MKTNTKNGDMVRVQGFEFTVTNLRTAENGWQYFNGVCTDDPANDRIRNTGYNGGCYRVP